MTISNTPGSDPVSERKAEVRKHAKNIKVAGGAGLISVVAGVTVLDTFFFALLVPLVMLGFIAYSGWQIKKIVDHEDQW